MYRILSTSENERLLLTRNEALGLAGFTVVSPRCPEQAPLLAAERDVNAIIIGHSVKPDARKTIIQVIRRLLPKCLVVFVYVSPEVASEPLADLTVDVSEGLAPLIHALQESLSKIQEAVA